MKTKLPDLVALLADLYPTRGDAELVMRSAEMDPNAINWDGNAKVFWMRIVVHTNQHGKVEDLVGVAKRDFPTNPDLVRLNETSEAEVVEYAKSRRRVSEIRTEMLATHSVRTMRKLLKEADTLLEEYQKGDTDCRESQKGNANLEASSRYELITILAELYPTSERARLLIVHRVNLDPSLIDFGGPPAVFWMRIVEEAALRKQVPAIIQAAIKDYPERREELTKAMRIAGLAEEPIQSARETSEIGPEFFKREEIQRLENEIRTVIKKKTRLRLLLLLSGILVVVLISVFIMQRWTLFGTSGGLRLPEMIRIPSGTFQMGSGPEEINSLRLAYPDWPSELLTSETPRQVTVGAFYIGKFEVTNQQYSGFLQDNPRFGRIEELGASDHPVVNVSWQEAAGYCDWLRRVTGKRYRLPSEVEWEWAARGSDGRRFPWGQDPPSIELANFGQGYQSPPPTTPVGATPGDRSPFDVMDMAGNVAEWCVDTWTPATQTRVVRGGSWIDQAFYVRCAVRREYPATIRRNDLGFRVAMDP